MDVGGRTAELSFDFVCAHNEVLIVMKITQIRDFIPLLLFNQITKNDTRDVSSKRKSNMLHASQLDRLSDLL